MPNLTPIVEMELAGRGAGWTAVTADVVGAVRARHGINGAGPSDRTASSGTLTFALNNSARNSGATLGYYSPGNANCRSGFGLGIRVRLRVTDPATATTTTRFVGWITAVTPAAGSYGPRLAAVVATDWIDQAARSNIRGIATQINKRSDQLVTTLVNSIATAPEATSYGTGSETFAYALDTARDDQPNPVLQELARVVMSELGFFYCKANGTVLFEARNARVNTADAVTITNTMADLPVTVSAENVFQKIQVVTHPRTVDAAATSVLYRLGTATQIGPGQTLTLLGPYTDPTDRASRVGGTDLQTPVATTDYVLNAAADGSGADLTANLTVVAAFGGNGVRWTLTNAGTTSGYITKLQCRGKGIYDYETTVAEAIGSALATPLGELTAIVDMPMQSNPYVGQDAALYLLGLFGPDEDGIPQQVSSVTLRQQSAALQTQMAVRDVGDRVRLEETVTGVARSYYIQMVDFTIAPAGVASVTWGLLPADVQQYWSLGVVGFSELGTTTRLSY